MSRMKSRRRRQAGRLARAAGREAVSAISAILIVSLLVFLINNYRSPMDVARGALGREVAPSQLHAYVKQYRLDRPLYARYATWLGDLVQGNLGTSVLTQRPVAGDVLPRLRRTFLLCIVALIIALPLGVAIGMFMARRYGSGPDLTLSITTVVLAALPEFVIGIALISIFGIWLGVLPVDSSALAFGDLRDRALAYVLPATTLAIGMGTHIARVTRATGREALASRHVEAAVLRGLGRRRLVWDYGARNAALPIINTVAINMVAYLSGVIVVENVFGFPGIGQLLVSAVAGGDTPTVEAVAVILAATFIGISLLVDLTSLYFNPRLRSAT